MTHRDRLGVAAAVAVLLAGTAVWPVFAAPGWLPRTVGAVLTVALASAAARRTRLPGAAQPLATLTALVAYLVLAFAASTLHHVLLPGRDTVQAFGALLDAAGVDLAQYATPAPATVPLVLLVAAGVGATAVVVDALATLAGRPAVTGLPLLVLFAVPSGLLSGGLGWVPFVLGATGWLALLLVDGQDAASRWGTPQRTGPGDAAALGRVGRRIGGAALGVAVLAPALVPGLDGRLFPGNGNGGAGDGASRSITTYNPITRLRGELTLPEPVDVLRYTTSDAEPDYLRMTTLGVYDGAGWRQDVLRGNLRDDGVDDPLPTPAGLTGSQRTRPVVASVTIDRLDAYWLPAPATPSTVDVAGPWMWDPRSQSVFATRSNTAKVGTYSVQATRVLPDPTRLVDADPPPEVAPYATPVDATDTVRAITARVVRDARSDYERAAALQAFFRNPANRFTYAEDTQSGGSPDALEDFLRSRRGFCEQYASAMGAMLRLAGVPSRVAVGFTPGTRQPDGSLLVTTDEAHAWPEAWFAGTGWVRFEPTPSRGGITAPVYAAPAPVNPTLPGAPADTSSAVPGGTGDVSESAAERKERLAAEAEARALSDGGAVAGDRPTGRLAAGGAVALLLLVGPAALHRLRRYRRWARPTPEAAWQQLTEDASDLGHGWRGAESPRAAAARLAADAALPDDAVAALGRLTVAVERSRYARPGPAPAAGDPGGNGPAPRSAPAGPAQDVRTVGRALRSSAGRAQRLRATWLPGSTLGRLASRSGTAVADLLDAGDRAIAAAAARVRRRSA